MQPVSKLVIHGAAQLTRRSFCQEFTRPIIVLNSLHAIGPERLAVRYSFILSAIFQFSSQYVCLSVSEPVCQSAQKSVSELSNVLLIRAAFHPSASSEVRQPDQDAVCYFGGEPVSQRVSH